jgi:hypothetical protein
MSFQLLTREQIANLSPDEKKDYQRAANRERVRRYREANPEKTKEYSREYKKQYISRPDIADKYKDLNKQHNKVYREKIKSKKDTNNIVSSILNDIIDTVPRLKLVEGQLKKRRGRPLGSKNKSKTLI